jgi:hypothetical protein
MSTKITAPVKTEGRQETYFGSQLVVFQDGEAEVDFEINDGLKAYLRSTGYGIGSTKAKAPDTDVVIADPRDYDSPAQVGTDLRDAAVDPRDSDFLAPTNAGQANPHGGEVVAPGIHAIGPGPIVPGTVGSPGYQEAKEVDTAEAVLVDGEPVPKVTAALNGIARAEYALTKAEGKAKGLAQELDGKPAAEDFTAEERELLGLDDIEDPSTGDPAPDPDGSIPTTVEEDLENEDPDADEGDPADENTVQPEGEPDDAVADAETLKGKELEEALRAANLPLTGSADERRARLAEHRAQG